MVTTHYMDEARLCQRVGVISQGKLLALNSPAQLKATQMRGEVLEISTAAPDQALRGLSVAQAISAQVQAPAQLEAVALAQTRVGQAEAAIHLLDTTLDRLKLASQVTGAVTSQMIHTGEVAQPGAPLLTVTDLSRVKLAVYVPAGRIGQVQVGQKAQVTVDAYPSRQFSGTVTHINAQTEFTPKNVQTQEERVKTVFRVEITLDNPRGELKPGMPADAVFE